MQGEQTVKYAMVSMRMALLHLNFAQSFKPGLILVSAGFDGTAGHPATLGGYRVSPACFGILTSYLVGLSQGKVRGLRGRY